MKNLRTLRESKSLSQQKLADKFDLSQSQIQNYETGTYEPDIETMKKLAEYFDTSVDYLIGRTDIMRKIEPVSDSMVNEHELEFINRYRQLQPNQRQNLSMYMDALEGEK